MPHLSAVGISGLQAGEDVNHRLAFLSPVFYIALGWMIVVNLEGLLTMVPLEGIVWLVAGGLFYTVGIVFYAIDRLPYNHGIWHGFVVAGSLCHYLSVLRYVLPI